MNHPMEYSDHIDFGIGLLGMPVLRLDLGALGAIIPMRTIVSVSLSAELKFKKHQPKPS